MRPLRILHTADWHLGHTLLGHGRDYEHARFLEWLNEQIVEREVDVLLVAGDVFDGRMPSGAAQAAYYGFLARLRHRSPRTEVVVIAGNHDSPSRLAAPGPILGMLGVHVISSARASRARGGSAEDLALAIRIDGRPALGVVAVPFVRASDLHGVGDGLDPAQNAAALRELYASVAAAARAAVGPHAPIVALGHAHVRGARLSPKSERGVFAGFSADAGAVERSAFPDCAYVALGHLHFPQDVTSPKDGGPHEPGRPRIRYSGSPLPLALVEAEYPHSVSLVEVSADDDPRVHVLPVPRFVEMVAIGGECGGASLEHALARIAALPRADEVAAETHPWLEVRLSPATGEEMSLRPSEARAQIDKALAGRAARLVRLAVEAPRGAEAASDAAAPALSDLDVRDVLRRRWAELGDRPLTAAHERVLGAAFLAALAAVEEERARQGAARALEGELG